MATEKSDVVPQGISPDESPFALPPAYEGFPFDKDGEEARAIREVIEQAELERSEKSGKRPLPDAVEP